MKKQAKKLFDVFQEGYTKRDPEWITPFMEALFEDEVGINVIGTGNAEIFQSKEEVEELFKGDWLYWGDLRVKLEGHVHQDLSNHDLFIVWGDLTYTYTIDDTTDGKYYGYIKGILEEAKSEDVAHIRHQESKVHYILDHYLHARKGNKRKEDYPIVMVFLCEEKAEDYYVRALTFTNPPEGRFPDERIHPFTGYDKDHEKNISMIKKVGKDKLGTSIFAKEKAKDFVFLDIDGRSYSGEQAKEKFTDRRSFYDWMDIHEEQGLIYQKDKIKAMTFLGSVGKKMNEEYLRKEVHREILEVMSSDKSEKNKMFVMRRKMSFLEKELALGEDFAWSFRVFVVTENDEIKMIQFSYPMDMILEGKYA